MSSKRFFSALITFLILATTVALGQDVVAVDPLEAVVASEPELTWSDYSVKAYTVQVFGGWFGGAEYLNLPILGPRVQFAEDPKIMSYSSGDWFRHGDQEGELNYIGPDRVWDAPIKTIEDGFTIGLKLGSYVTEQFHIDICFAYSSAQAALTMVNVDKNHPNYLTREEIDRDPSVQILRAALQMTYDVNDFQLLGFRPYFGLGFGGVLNRFSNLRDRGALYLLGTFGMQNRVYGNASLFVQADLAAFAMARDELHYTTTVTYKDVSAGISFYFDTIPPEIRALHEAQQAERRRRR